MENSCHENHIGVQQGLRNADANVNELLRHGGTIGGVHVPGHWKTIPGRKKHQPAMGIFRETWKYLWIMDNRGICHEVVGKMKYHQFFWYSRVYVLMVNNNWVMN